MRDNLFVPSCALLPIIVVAVFFSNCSRSGFTGSQPTKKSDGEQSRDVGEQNAFGQQQSAYTDQNGLTDVDEGRVPATIPVARVCSNRYSESAGTNLLNARNGVIVKFIDPLGEKSMIIDDKDPVGKSREIIQNRTITVNAPQGVWDVIICDKNMPNCSNENPQAGFSLGPTKLGRRSFTPRFTQGSLGSAQNINFDQNYQSPGRMGILYNINEQQNQMFGAMAGLMSGFFNQANGLQLAGGAADLAMCDETASPLMVDLGSKGIQLSQIKHGAKFDIDGDGTLDQISWPTNTENAFIGLDRNGNGKLDDINELFGNSTIGDDGEKTANGFEALIKYDSNDDQQITEDDDIYDELVLWQDKNRNGKTDDGEVSTFRDQNVSSINLSYQEGLEYDYWGNQTRQRSAATINGKAKVIFDIWFLN